MKITGQITPTMYQHRIYADGEFSIRLITFSRQDNPDVIEGRAVQTFVPVEHLQMPICRCQSFGATPAEYSKAADEFKKRVEAYISKGLIL